MIQTSFKINYSQHFKKHSSSSTNTGKALSFKSSDTFVKSEVNNSISFSQSQKEKQKELRRLQNEYLSLQCKRSNRCEQIFCDDGIIIEKALMAGEAIDKIYNNHQTEFKYQEATRNIFRLRTTRKLLEDYRTFLIKRKELLEKIDILKEQINSVSIGSSNEKPLLDYCDFMGISAEREDFDHTHSKYFRYTSKYIPLKTMVEDKIKQFDFSENKPMDNSNKLKILVVGLGKHCEDVYDYSTYAYDAIKDKNIILRDIIDIEMVDLRPAFQFERDYLSPPEIRKNFLNDDLKKLVIEHPNNRYKEIYTYPVSVLDFVADEMYDKSKFHSSTPIETFSSKYKGVGYDFLSINNVLEYPGYGDKDHPSEIQQIPNISRFLNPFRSKKNINDKEFDIFKTLIANILKMVKPGGYLSCSMDPGDTRKLEDLITSVDKLNEFEHIQDGLYRRKAALS